MLTALGGGVRRTAYRGLANVRWTEGRPKTSVRQPSALTVVKASSVRRHEILHGHRRFTGQFGDDLVFAREDAGLIVEGDRAQNAGS